MNAEPLALFSTTESQYSEAKQPSCFPWFMPIQGHWSSSLLSYYPLITYLAEFDSAIAARLCLMLLNEMFAIMAYN
jgi:hypothetical protein